MICDRAVSIFVHLVALNVHNSLGSVLIAHYLSMVILPNGIDGHNISICGRAVSSCGRVVSICGRSVSICGREVSMCRRAVSICGRSEK